MATAQERMQYAAERLGRIEQQYTQAKAQADAEFERAIASTRDRRFHDAATLMRDEALKTARAERDADLKAAKAELKASLADRRAELAPQRHAARLAVAPDNAPRSEVMRHWVGQVATADDLVGLHADALAAGDLESAWYLEQNGTDALARALNFPDGWQRDAASVSAVFPWTSTVENVQRQRVAAASAEYDAAERQVSTLELLADSPAHMTSAGRAELAAIYGVKQENIPEE